MKATTGVRLGLMHLEIQLSPKTRLWYMCMKMLWLAMERVNLGRELIGSPEWYSTERGIFFLLPSTNRSDTCSENYDWQMWTDRLTVGLVEH